MLLLSKLLNKAGALLAGRADFHIQGSFRVAFLCTYGRGVQGASVVVAGWTRATPRSKPIKLLYYGAVRNLLLILRFTLESSYRLPGPELGIGEQQGWILGNLTFELIQAGVGVKKTAEVNTVR